MVELSLREDRLTLPVAKTRLVVLGDPHGDLLGLEAALKAESGKRTAFVSTGDNIGYASGPDSSELCRRLEEAGVPSVYGNHEAWLRDDGRMAIVADRGASDVLSWDARRFSSELPLRIAVELEAEPGLDVVVVHSLVVNESPVQWDFVRDDNAADVADLERAKVVFLGHSHGPAIHAIADDGRVETRRLDLTEAVPPPVAVRLCPDRRYVVDAGTLGRPGYHPEPGRFDLATWAVLDVAAKQIRLVAALK